MPPSHELAPVAPPPPAYPVSLIAAPYPGWGGAPPMQAPSSSLLAVFDNLMQHARLFGIVFGAVLLAGLAYLLATAPVYRAESLIQIESRSPRTMATSLAPQLQNEPQAPLGFMQGEIEILRSREVVSRAIAQTRADIKTEVASRLPLVGNLYARWAGRDATAPVAPPFDTPRLRSYSWGGEALRLAEMSVPPAWYGEPLRLVAGANGDWTLFDDDNRRLAAGRIDQKVDFALGGRPASIRVAALRAREGTRFDISAENPVAVYDQFTRNLKIDEAGRQSGVLRVALHHANPRFAKEFLDALTAAYLAHHVSVTSGESTRALQFLDGQLPAVKTELDRAEEALNKYRTGTNTINVALESETALRRISDLEQQRIGMELKLQQLGQRYTNDHPEVLSTLRQLGRVSGEVRKVQTQLRQSPQQERDVVRLQRDVQVATQLYTTLLNNAQALRIAQAGMSGNARLVDPAGVLSKPVKPVPLTVLSVTTALGLLLALACVMLVRMVRPTVRTSDELEQRLGLQTVASIPESAGQAALERRAQWREGPRQPSVLAIHSPNDPAVESVRALRNQMLMTGAASGPHTVLITAPTAGTGKSFVAANLAVLAASGGRRVLLVDLDLRAPRQYDLFGIDPARDGIVDVVADRATLEEGIVKDVLPGLDLLLPGRLLGSPGDLLLQPRFRTLMEEVSRVYGLVVIDSAPVLPVGDTLLIGRLADTAYLVVRSENSSAREVRDAARRLESAGVTPDGLILNGVKRTRLENLPYRSYFAAASARGRGA